MKSLWNCMDAFVVLCVMALIAAGLFGINLHWENLPFFVIFVIVYFACRNA